MSNALTIVVGAVRSLARIGVLTRDVAEREMDATTEIAELGLDSMGKLELMSELEHRLDLNIPESEFRGLATLGDVAALVQRLQHQVAA